MGGVAERSGGAALETGRRGAAEAEGVSDKVRRGGGGRWLDARSGVGGDPRRAARPDGPGGPGAGSPGPEERDGGGGTGGGLLLAAAVRPGGDGHVRPRGEERD